MKKDMIVNPAYREQQEALDEIAAKLRVVAYRPNYHGEKGDKNTVLFYLNDDEAHNRLVDRQPTHYTRSEAADLRRGGVTGIPDECIYRDHFWSFENTDANGFADYDFANFGRLDLRPLRWRETLEGSIRLALTRKKQNMYIAQSGGWGALREADETYNDMNRELIAALKQTYGTAYLGDVNFYDEKRKEIAAGKGSIYEEYTGQLVYDFGCSFCVPMADAELEDMIRRWNSDETLTKKWNDIDKIISRVDAIGGINLIWF